MDQITMRVAAAPARVFSLLCPVREADWLDGWRAEVVRSTSGVAERGCVFETGAGADPCTWIIHTHELAARWSLREPEWGAADRPLARPAPRASWYCRRGGAT